MFRLLTYVWMMYFGLGCLMHGNDVRNLFRFIDAADHYAEHNAEAGADASIDIIDFINLHFGSSEHREKKHGNDDHLPFQASHLQILLFIDQPVVPEAPKMQLPSFLLGYHCKMHLDHEVTPLVRPPHC
jgi:hypothetical protein